MQASCCVNTFALVSKAQHMHRTSTDLFDSRAQHCCKDNTHVGWSQLLSFYLSTFIHDRGIGEERLHTLVNQRREVTCAQDLQQSIDHLAFQFLTCYGSALEVPAAAPSTDLLSSPKTAREVVKATKNSARH